MDDKSFEGTLVLEKLAAVSKVEEFFDAVDADDFKKASELMEFAGIDSETIEVVLKKMREADGEH